MGKAEGNLQRLNFLLHHLPDIACSSLQAWIVFRGLSTVYDIRRTDDILSLQLQVRKMQAGNMSAQQLCIPTKGK